MAIKHKTDLTSTTKQQKNENMECKIFFKLFQFFFFYNINDPLQEHINIFQTSHTAYFSIYKILDSSPLASLYMYIKTISTDNLRQLL